MKFFCKHRINLSLWVLALVLALPISLLAQNINPGPFGSFFRNSTAADTATLTPLQMYGILTGTPTAAANYTTPTATAMCNAIATLNKSTANTAASFKLDLWIKNTSAGANTITLVAGTGFTLTGTKTAAQNTVRHFIFWPTSCASGSQAWSGASLETASF